MTIDIDQKVFFHNPRDNVALANKISHKMIQRLIVDINRRTALLNHTIIDNKDLVAHCQCFTLVMRDKDKGDSQAALQSPQFSLHLHS